MENQLLPNLLLVFTAFDHTVWIGFRSLQYFVKVRTTDDLLQRPGLEVDLQPVFLDQRDDVFKLLVVFRDIHTMRQTAGMNGAIGSDVQRSVAHRFTNGMFARLLKFIPVGRVDIALDLDV